MIKESRIHWNIRSLRSSQSRKVALTESISAIQYSYFKVWTDIYYIFYNFVLHNLFFKFSVEDTRKEGILVTIYVVIRLQLKLQPMRRSSFAFTSNCTFHVEPATCIHLGALIFSATNISLNDISRYLPYIIPSIILSYIFLSWIYHIYLPWIYYTYTIYFAL